MHNNNISAEQLLNILRKIKGTNELLKQFQFKIRQMWSTAMFLKLGVSCGAEKIWDEWRAMANGG